MNENQKEILLSWLNNAHAMEESLIQNLEEKVKDADDDGESEVKEKIEEHLGQTRRHAKDVEKCITSLGGDTSESKDLVGKMTGFLQGSMKSIHDDVLVKNAIESYAAENLEIALYTSIIAAAEALEEEEIVDTCSIILEEEEEMAEWLMSQIPAITAEYVLNK